MLSFTVKVCAGRDLAPKDKPKKGELPTSDPFVVVGVVDLKGKLQKKQKTPVVTKNLNPVWTSKNTFSYEFDPSKYPIFRISCWDKDRVGKDFMGQYDFEAASLASLFPPNQATEQWLPLGKRNGKEELVSGELCVSLTLLGQRLPASSSSFSLVDDPKLTPSSSTSSLRLPSISAPSTPNSAQVTSINPALRITAAALAAEKERSERYILRQHSKAFPAAVKEIKDLSSPILCSYLSADRTPVAPIVGTLMYSSRYITFYGSSAKCKLEIPADAISSVSASDFSPEAILVCTNVKSHLFDSFADRSSLLALLPHGAHHEGGSKDGEDSSSSSASSSTSTSSTSSSSRKHHKPHRADKEKKRDKKEKSKGEKGAVEASPESADTLTVENPSAKKLGKSFSGRMKKLVGGKSDDPDSTPEHTHEHAHDHDQHSGAPMPATSVSLSPPPASASASSSASKKEHRLSRNLSSKMRKLIGLDHEHHPSTTTPEPVSPASLDPAPSILAEPTVANPASITAPSQDVSADGLQETKASSSKKNSHAHSHAHLPSESHSHSHRQSATFSPSDPVPQSEDAEAIHKKKHKRRSRILPSDYPREPQPIEDIPTVESSTDQSTPLAETPFVGTATLAVDPQSPSAAPLPPPPPPSTSAALVAETEAVGFEMAAEPNRGPSPAHDAPNPLSRKLKRGFQGSSRNPLLLAASAEDPDHESAAFPAAPVATQVSSPHPALAPVAAAFSLPPRRTIATDRKDAGFLKTRLAYDSQEKTLVAHLIEAYDVLPMDSNGFSDPYVKIYLDSKKVFKSPTLKKTLDPVFNVTATIPKLDLSQTLLIEVWDWDRIGSDDFIGYLELPLSLFAAHPVREQWDALNPEKPRSKKASKSSKTSAPSTPATSASSTPVTSVTVLPDTMAFAPSLLPLPFLCEAPSPLPPSSSSSSSSTMTSSSSSIFVPSPSPADASSPASVLPAKLPELPPPPLCTDASPPPARRPDPQFSSSNVTPSDPESAALPVPPSGKDADFGGFLLTSLRYDAKERRVHGDIFEARDLLPMDSNGLSDPYVKVFLGNNAKAVHTTATIKKTLFPKFGESFSVALAECSGTLTFEVWDWDRLSKDDFIGSTSLELSLPRERVWDRLSHQATPIKKLSKKQLPLPISASTPQVDATSKSTPALPGDASLPLAASPTSSTSASTSATLNSNSPVFPTSPSNPNIPSSSPSASSTTSSLTAGSRVIGTVQEGKEITVRVLAHFNAASSRFTCTFVAAQAYRGKPTSLRLTSEGAEKKVKLGDKVELKIPQRKRLEAKPAVEFELTVQDGKKQEVIGVGLISLEKEFGQETAPQQLSIHLVSSDKRDLRSNKPSSSAPALTADLLGELATQESEAQTDQAAHENTRRIIEETRLDRREMRGSFFINKPLLYIPTHQDSLSHSLSRAAELSSHSQRQLDQLASYFASPDSRKDHPFLLQCLVILILLSLSCFAF